MKNMLSFCMRTFRAISMLLLLPFVVKAQTCTGITKFKSGFANISWVHCTDDGQVVLGGVFYSSSQTIDAFTVNADSGAYMSTWVAFMDSNWVVQRAFLGISLKGSGPTFAQARFYEMVVDDQKNVYFTGTHADPVIQAGALSQVTDSSAEAFIVRLDSLGTPTLLKSFGSRTIGTNFKHDDMGRAVDVDAAGNIYLTGLFEGPWLYLNGDSVANSQGWASVTRTDVFTVSLDPTGQTRWLKACGSPNFDDAPLGISVGDDGGVAITGQTGIDNANFIFGANSYLYKDVTFSYQGFVARYNALGQEQWFFKLEPYYGGGPDFVGYDVATDEAGSVYAIGSMDAWGIFNGDTVSTSNYNSYFIVKIDTFGQKRFVRYGNSDTFYPYPGFTTYRNGRLVTIGQSYTNQLTFDHLGSVGSTNAFVVVHDTTGTVQWLRGATVVSASDVAFLGVSVDALDRIHVSGIASGGVVTVDTLAFNAPTGGAYVLYRFDSIPYNGFTMNLSVNGSDTVVCGYSRQIQGISNPSGSQVKYTWWADNDTISLPNFVGANLNASPKFTTMYIASANYKGCVVVDTVVLYSVPLPLEAGSDTSLCLGDSLQLNATVYVNGTYAWTPAAGLSNPAVSNPLLIPASSGQYICTLNAYGCTSADTFLIDVNGPVSASFTSNTGALTLNFTGQITGAAHFRWEFGDGTTDTVSLQPVHTYANDSLWNVCLYAWNDCYSDTFCLAVDLTGVDLPETDMRNLQIADFSDHWEIIGGRPGEALSCTLMDAGGRSMALRRSAFNQYSFEKAGLASGIYMLRITDSHDRYKVFRLIRQ